MRTRLLFYLIFSTLSISIFTSCKDEDKEPVPPTDNTISRVVFVYMVAENDLSSSDLAFDTDDIKEMLLGRTYMSDNDRLIIYFDNAQQGTLPCFYEISNRTQAYDINSLTPVYTYHTDFNSASATTFDMAMKYVYDHYPADSYGIVLWSHGSGWIPYHANETKTRAFGVDTGNNSYGSWGEQMNINDMATVLKKYSNIDFLLFDACFMQSIEVAYELKDVTRYILASPTETPGPGAPYNFICKPMFSDKLHMDNIMMAYYNQYIHHPEGYGVLLSVIDCAKLESFAQVHSRLFHKYKDNATKELLDNTLNYFNFDLWHGYSEMPDCYDMKGVMQQIITDPEDWLEWHTAFKRAVPHSIATDWWYSDYDYFYMLYVANSEEGGLMLTDQEQYGGISMYIEQDKYKNYPFYQDYLQTTWAKATRMQ